MINDDILQRKIEIILTVAAVIVKEGPKLQTTIILKYSIKHRYSPEAPDY